MHYPFIRIDRFFVPRFLSLILVTLIAVTLILTMLASQSSEAADPDSKTDVKSDSARVAKSKKAAALSPSKVARLAAEIDKLIEKQLKANKQQPNEMSDDETFVRRAYLDIIGRIPTKDETVDFLESKRQRKRAMLIDELLASDGYVSHQYNYFADLFRVQSRMRNISGTPFIDFIKESLESNKPYDQFVQEMLTADGPATRKGNGATGYMLRDFGMPEDNMSNTVRIFLGTRLECAQCHDHPFDKWTQRDYYEMVAFTGGLQYRLRGADAPPQTRELFQMASKGKQRKKYNELTGDEKNLRRSLQRLVEPLTYGISGSGTGSTKLPKDFLGDDGQPGEQIAAKTMFEKESLVDPIIKNSPEPKKRNAKMNRKRAFTPLNHIDSREAYAQWMTSPNNPRFAKVIANRLWKRAFGIGVIEPVDDLNDYTIPSNPDLMNYLSSLMVELDFDIKQYIRVIHSTNAYQRDVTRTDIQSPEKYNFPGPALRRMSGEQMWDSLLTLTVPDIDSREGYSRDYVRYYRGASVYDVYDRVSAMSAEEILEMAKNYSDGGMKPIKLPGGNSTAKPTDKTSIPASAKQRQKVNRAERAKLGKQAMALQQKLREAQRTKDVQAIRALKVEKRKLDRRMFDAYSRQAYDLVRASELPSPAPPAHFVRQFGQSDREQIENSNKDPSVPQVLSLMNGFVEKRIANAPYTVLMKNASEAPKLSDRIDAVFLTMLNRYPTRTEKSRWAADAKKNPQDVSSDVIWVLANSSEFMFIR